MKVFLTATDTGAGKTYIACRWLRAHPGGLALKPLAAGVESDGTNEDVRKLAEAQHLNEAAICFQCWKTPAAPAIAAEMENAPLDRDALLAWCRRRMEQSPEVLVEGIGGVRVPLCWGFEVRDWIAALELDEVWLVAAARIGAINHTLLSIDALAAVGCAPTRVIINEVEQGARTAAEMLHTALERYRAPFAIEHLGFGD